MFLLAVSSASVLVIFFPKASKENASTHKDTVMCSCRVANRRPPTGFRLNTSGFTSSIDNNSLYKVDY